MRSSRADSRNGSAQTFSSRASTRTGLPRSRRNAAPASTAEREEDQSEIRHQLRGGLRVTLRVPVRVALWLPPLDQIRGDQIRGEGRTRGSLPPRLHQPIPCPIPPSRSSVAPTVIASAPLRPGIH